MALKGPYENFGMIGNNVPGLTNIGATMSALILSTVASIHLHGGCELSGMFIHRLGMDFTEGTNSSFAGLAIRIAGSSPTIAFASATANGSTITVNYAGASNQFVVGSYAVVGTRPSSDFAGIYKVTSVTSSSFTANSTANGTFTGNNASISRSADDVKITNCFIVGFEQAIEAILAQRLVIRDVKIDCNTGINLENCYDVAKLDNIHCWPFATIGAQALGYAGTNWWFRNGYGIRNWASDATHITNCFVFGYFFGFWITGNGTSLVNCGVDGVAGAGLVNTGFLFDDLHLNTNVSNCYAWAYPIGYTSKGASSVVSFSNCSTNGISLIGFVIESGTANIIGGQSYGSGGTAIASTGGTVNAFGHAVQSTMTATSGTINTISTATTSFVS